MQDSWNSWLAMRLFGLNLAYYFLVFMSTIASAAGKPAKFVPKKHDPKYAAIVMDAATGKVLEQENAHSIRYPASLTKMMTLYLTFEALKSGRLKLYTKMTTSKKASRQPPSKFGLIPGEQVSVYQAVMGLVTKSANDVAVVLAENLAGSEEAFARRMTKKARALGMRKTVFKNASGLPCSTQITSAYDMALLSRALYRDFPEQYKYFKNQSFTHKGTVYRNHNQLLGKVPGLDGIKTGFIMASGYNLAASAVRYDVSRKPHRLITVVLGGPNRHWRDRRVTELMEINFRKRGLSRPANEETDVTQLVIQNLLDKSEFTDSEVPDDLFSIPAIAINETRDGKNTPASLDQLIEAVSFDSAGSPKNQVKPASWVVPASAPVPSRRRAKQTTVQVGSYRNAKDARKRASQARKLAGEGQTRVVHMKSGKKRLVAAQVTGLNLKQAQALCHKLRQNNQPCLILK